MLEVEKKKCLYGSLSFPLLLYCYYCDDFKKIIIVLDLLH